MLDYIIKVLLFQTLFLVVYDLFLKRETFFQWNRFYLMTTSVLAYVIPLVKIDRVQEIIPQEYVVLLPEVVLNPSTVIKEQLGQPITFFLVLKVIFWLGIAVASILFALRLYKLFRLITTHDKEFKPSYYLVWLHNNKAFSFFNYIFLGKETNNKTQIIEHELVHVKQKHSLDLLFFELQKIVCWFNPYSYLYQARISELHEFIADSKAIKTENKATYFNHLLAETFGVQNISFINPFFKHSLLKKRILMLNKSKSKQLLKLKYLYTLPILAGMLMYTSCNTSDFQNNQDNDLTPTSMQIKLKNTLVDLVKERIIKGTATNDDLKYIEKLSFSLTFPVTEKDYNQKDRILDMFLNMKRRTNRSKELYTNNNIPSMTRFELDGFIFNKNYNNLKNEDIPKILKIIKDSVKRHEHDRQLVIQRKVDNYLINKSKGLN
ncbi:hypothetical protein FF125_18950 [Aureibaculum algae]|uniref:Peptidase M56 domain-containing protein n=1 Tax=Aureibaculum algae TaxID=2584122 RepID=A0A5B7TVS1_9FLAO|nr:M56 family metallopeptidase [Aureibaculum algae]QCX40420.1 hypothetical protein FF125_18950 [Aureibaculum algae]